MEAVSTKRPLSAKILVNSDEETDHLWFAFIAMIDKQ